MVQYPNVKKAEESLRSAEKSLGEIKGAFETLEHQQTQGIKHASQVIAENKTKIEGIKKTDCDVKRKDCTLQSRA